MSKPIPFESCIYLFFSNIMLKILAFTVSTYKLHKNGVFFCTTDFTSFACLRGPNKSLTSGYVCCLPLTWNLMNCMCLIRPTTDWLIRNATQQAYIILFTLLKEGSCSKVLQAQSIDSDIPEKSLLGTKKNQPSCSVTQRR